MNWILIRKGASRAVTREAEGAVLSINGRAFWTGEGPIGVEDRYVGNGMGRDFPGTPAVDGLEGP